MRMSTLAVITTLGAGVFPGIAADATTPIDYRQRNEPFAPAASVSAEKQKPAANSTVQDKRVEKATVEKKTSPLRDREAAIEMKETRVKNVREKDSHRPEAIEHVTSGFDHRQSAISTAGDTTKPPMVAKYQDSLVAASATNMARFPAMDKATSAKINRFVFRKNPADASGTVNGSAVTPAAGGSVLQK
jgi:hypothetical protein